MRVLFIQDNAISESIGICALSAYLKERGHDCDLLLLTHTKNWADDIVKFSPDLIGFTIFTGMQHSVYKMVLQVKGKFDIPVIAGGPHPTFYPDECLGECKGIDMICRGDGEETLLKLVNALEERENYTNIPGLWVREGEHIFKNSISPLIKDVTTLPMPDRNLYFRYDFMRDFPMKRFISGYGCPYMCSYCNQPFFEKEYKKEYSVNKSAFMRSKTVDQVIEEILYVKNNSALKRVHFSDDLFSVRRDWLREFAEKYPKAIGVPFSCNMRFDLVNEEVADLLKTSMCYCVQAGIESGNDRLRNEVIGKNLPRHKIVKGANLLHDRGIKIYTTNIIALPSETIENAKETIALNQEIKTDFMRINTLMPFPKTGIADYAMENGYLPKDYTLRNLSTSDSLFIHCKTPYENEFKNISCLFRFLVKYPFLMKIFNPLIRVKNNIFYRFLGMFNLIQDVRYFKIDFYSGFRFFLNTIHRDKEAESMHWIPGMAKKKKVS